MNNLDFIHYGHDKFDKNLFNKIENRKFFTKPTGGFWACRKDGKYGWKQWCEDNDYSHADMNTKFEFNIKNDSKILTICHHRILKILPQTEYLFNIKPSYIDCVYLDFEKLSRVYDGIEVIISADNRLYWNLYGWDCDSILIMNNKIINLEE
jgi:hypothetical protein